MHHMTYEIRIIFRLKYEIIDDKTASGLQN